MRDRLLLAFVALTLAVVAVFMVVRGHATAAMVHAEQRATVVRSADTVAALLGAGRREVTARELARALSPGERISYVTADGRVIEAARGTTAGSEPQHGGLAVTRPVKGGGRVTLSLPADVVDARVASALLPLVLVSLGMTVVAAAAAVWLSRRLSRPFHDLAEIAERIGRGNYDVPVPRYTIPEADTVARVLKASAADLGALVRRERDFAAHASHELRTPITATRLELEDLALSPQTPPEVVARLSDALEQLDRLSATVDGMLDASRESRYGASVDIDLAALVRDSVARWQGVARDRRIEVRCDGVVAVRLPAGSLIQIMDALLRNAVSHGEGTVTVSVSEAPAYAQVTVADEGPHDRAVEGTKRPPTHGAAGLATAGETAEALGGRLRLTDDACTTFSLVVPRLRRETVVP